MTGERLKNKIFQSRDLCLRALDTNSLCAKNVRRNEEKMRKVVLTAVQMQCSVGVEQNIQTADRLVRQAAGEGANVVLLPELFERHYFCQQRNYSFYGYAKPVEENDAVCHFQKVSEELGLVIPVSFYERDKNVLYNSVAMLDCGKLLGVYRKTHIPDDHYYQEKFYFTPGNTGFRVWDTSFGKIGVGICWDQWFPEAARCMALEGAELLLYPTAIGSEPILECDSMPHWRRVMQGHAAANIIPVAAANRFGTETVEPDSENGGQRSELCFYGSSFLTDSTGELVACAARTGECVLTADYDLDELREERFNWGLYRDRRPEMYSQVVQ